MTAMRWTGVAGGAFIALVIPVSYGILAPLVSSGIVHLETEGSGMETITIIALWEILLGPIGLLIVGLSARLGGLGWSLLIAIGVPGLFFVWFLCVATLSGALGSPF